MPSNMIGRGFKDLLPNEAIFRNELIRKIETVYKSFGFYPIDTPYLERLELLNAKNTLGEGTKELFEVKQEPLALRYDQTVSLARVVATNQDLTLPFKRYAIGKCWRYEEPQKARYREFTQADVDIVGGLPVYSDAEAIAANCKGLEALGLNYKVSINDRRIVESLLEGLKIDKELWVPVMRALDKVDKIGKEGVAKLLEDMKIPGIDDILEFITFEGSNDQKLSYINDILKKTEPLEEINSLIGLLGKYNLSSNPEINFSIMRGFDYYTSFVFEYSAVGSEITTAIGGGGRYDNLIGLYGPRQLNAVGGSLGVDRIMDVLSYENSKVYTEAKVFIAFVGFENYDYALKVANDLRGNGIYTDLNVAKKNLAHELEYADSLGFKYVIIIGKEEERLGKVKLRNLEDGEEELLSEKDAIEFFKTQ
ncbi:MAG: histidine--tRNA ligase [Candidatus Micrarchaeia archaeon]